MPLPAPNLDDLRFQQDLVDEARRRIVRYCPEWTDYNLSDPGVTLIELFAWMTEMLVYRLNRVPERNYIKFLDMMGIQLKPASSARAELTFYLSIPLPISAEDDTVVTVQQGMEVTTQPGEAEQAVTFTTDDKLVIAPPRLVQVRQAADFNRNYLSRLGIELFYTFDRQRPQVGDTFYLGFDDSVSIAGYLLRLTFECEETQAVGVRREDPPWVWECSVGNGEWEEVPLSTRPGEKDTTGGLNNPQGSFVLYLPLTMRPDQVHGRNAYWIRCRLEQRRLEQGMYAESPRVKSIAAHVLGGTVWATHAEVVRTELLGTSSGEPGQVYQLQHAPVLALRPEERVEVEELHSGEMVPIPWERVADFSDSNRYDRHFALDESTGEIRFGPAVRQPDGSIRQYGRVPEARRRLYMGAYRCGGGTVGNVPAGRIQIMRTAVPYVDHVINLRRAEGGRDQETMEEVQMRARRELRAQQRAVTADDFESLARGTSRSVVRVKCSAPAERARGGRGGSDRASVLPAGMIELLVVPSAVDALRVGDLSKLALEPDLCDQIQAHLDQYRLLTTTLRVREPTYLGIKVVADIVVAEYSHPDTVRARVKQRLNQLLTPLALEPDEQQPNWEGWPFGRDLYVSELYALMQQVPGVKHVLDVQLAYRTVVPNKEQPQSSDMAVGPGAEERAAPGLTQLGRGERVIQVAGDGLLCSLDHEIRVVEL